MLDRLIRSLGSKNQKQTPKKEVKENTTNTNEITQAVADVGLSEKNNVRSKNLDVVKEYEQSESKNAASFVVIGKTAY